MVPAALLRGIRVKVGQNSTLEQTLFGPAAVTNGKITLRPYAAAGAPDLYQAGLESIRELDTLDALGPP